MPLDDVISAWWDTLNGIAHYQFWGRPRRRPPAAGELDFWSIDGHVVDRIWRRWRMRSAAGRLLSRVYERARVLYINSAWPVDPGHLANQYELRWPCT